MRCGLAKPRLAARSQRPTPCRPDWRTGLSSQAYPAWVAPLAATVLIQTALSYLSRLIPTLAPVQTSASGLTPDAVGYLSAAGTAGSMLFLASGNPLIARLGPIRALQGGLAIAIIGVLLLITPTAAALFAS